MGFSVFRACMTVLIAIGLLALFIFPSQYLVRFSDAANETIGHAVRALFHGDLSAASAQCEVLARSVREDMPALERFLNHSDVDALDAAVSRAASAARLGAFTETLEALTEAEAILRRIRGIELFSWNSLL
ncbi:MAG: DUF4363 family protein [Clostridia bacterium]|nr:DUF4363 family protein [Clostridia bacterium]